MVVAINRAGGTEAGSNFPMMATAFNPHNIIGSEVGDVFCHYLYEIIFLELLVWQFVHPVRFRKSTFTSKIKNLKIRWKLKDWKISVCFNLLFSHPPILL